MAVETPPICARCNNLLGNLWYWARGGEARAVCPGCAKPGEKPCSSGATG